MKPGKVLTILTIALLALFLTGCGPTLEEKIAEVREKNNITTADVIDLLELEGVDAKPQRPGVTVNETWKNVAVYKLDGEHLLFIMQFDGAPWEREQKLSELGLRNPWNWGWDKEGQNEEIKNAVKAFKPEPGNYYFGDYFGYKNILAIYVPYLPVEEGMTSEEIKEKLDVAAATTGKVKHVFLEDLMDMQTSEYTAIGQYFTAKITSYLSEVPYKYNDRLIYIYLADSKCLIELNEEMVKPYTGQEFSIRCKGTLEGPFASSGSRGISGTIDNELSFSLGASNAETGYGKEPYTGPIQYEVTVTIGDDITETLIVGTEGTDSSK